MACLELYILDILQSMTDKDHPMTQEAICQELRNRFRIEKERRAVSKALSSMENLEGFFGNINIVTIRNRGVYLERGVFTSQELRILTDSVMSAKYLTPEITNNIVSKLNKMKSTHAVSNDGIFKNLDNDCKTENGEVLNIIQIITNAILTNTKIRFRYSKRNISGEVMPTSEHVASPWSLLVHNQYYYVMVQEDFKQPDDTMRTEIAFYRVDKIIECHKMRAPRDVLRDHPQFANGLVFDNFSAKHPYMYGDEPIQVTFRMRESVITQLYDWFGNNNRVISDPQLKGWARATITVSPAAFKHWAMQYLGNVEVLAPESLRAEIIKNIGDGLAIYNA